ncbi:4-amino-4-deoxy-L-arabinose transferase [Paenibacillus herberti]|uniref:4-amino-4-deoxy-L-arabinose transferase n=2 Tax=Paenibacillus herberti TaxID=1619309 RepID=A0A229NTS9_9BACL|nr:4-amino-4-deoxy-L-arabinose transferase [Paenibacillus herberti]
MEGTETSNEIKQPLRMDLWLMAAVLMAAFLNLYGIWDETYSNTYYTTAVGSMLQSWENFFYGSLDSAGSVTIDKPPLVFWIQAAFAYVFGLHGWSVILPQALAGIALVPLIYLCVKPTFGSLAARFAAFAMAFTPVGVAVARTNNIDAMLVFVLLLAAWFLLRGIRQNRISSLVIAFALIGVGFNMKMLQAYMVLPAFYLLYVLGVQLKVKKKYAVLAGSTALMLLISVSWAVIVDSIPADKRPYIGSSETNSVMELAFGYNGVSRLTGDRGGAGGQPPSASVPGQPQAGDGTAPRDGGGESGVRNGGWGTAPAGGGGGGMFATGTVGPLRLFQQELSGQASWLLPFALLSALALLLSFRWRGMNAKHKETLFWLAWLVPVGGFFSIAGFFHPYYLIMLAPPVAALAGAGASYMWAKYRESASWQAWLLPSSIAITALFQWFILQTYESTIGIGWSIAVAGLGLLVALVLAVQNGRERGAVKVAALTGLAAMLIGPAYWSATPIVYGQDAMIPAAGPTSGFGGGMGRIALQGMGGVQQGGIGMERPSQQGGVGDAQSGGIDGRLPGEMGMFPSDGGMRPGQGRGNTGVDQGLLDYLRKNQSTEYLLAVPNYNTAAPYIVDEKEKVVILHGFQNSDPVYDEEKLEELVRSGGVKYFLVIGTGSNSDLIAWIKKNGNVINASEYTTGSIEQTKSINGSFGRGGNAVLYEVTLD